MGRVLYNNISKADFLFEPDSYDSNIKVVSRDDPRISYAITVIDPSLSRYLRLLSLYDFLVLSDSGIRKIEVFNLDYFSPEMSLEITDNTGNKVAINAFYVKYALDDSFNGNSPHTEYRYGINKRIFREIIGVTLEDQLDFIDDYINVLRQIFCYFRYTQLNK